MAFDFRTINRNPSDPIFAYIAELQKQAGLKLAQDQAGQLDDSEDIFSDSNDLETKVSFNTMLAQHVFRFTKGYTSPIDPGRMATCWIRGYNVGAQMRDFSQFNHPAIIDGEPLLVDGIIDLGVNDESVDLKSTAVKFNRPTSLYVNEERMSVPDHADLHIDSLLAGEGFSVFFRVRIKDLAQQGGLSRTYCEKTDDATPNHGYMIKFESDGRVKVVVTFGGTETKKETAAGKVQADKVYMGFLTFAVTGNVIHLYLAEDTGSPLDVPVDETLSNSAGTVGWHVTSANHDIHLLWRGPGSSGGHSYGDFYDFEFYRPYGSFTGIVSSSQAANRFSNKMSISSITYGHVMITNHWSTADIIALLSSFTTASFTSTSFNT